MSPEQQRKSNTVLGGVFLGTGVVAWIMAMFFAVVPNPPVPAPSHEAAKVDLNSCKTALGELGYVATIEGPRIRIFEPLTSSPKDQLEKASIAANMCRLTMKEFCMGTSCQNPGLTMVLLQQSSNSGNDKAAQIAEVSSNASAASVK